MTFIFAQGTESVFNHRLFFITAPCETVALEPISSSRFDAGPVPGSHISISSSSKH